MNRLVLLCIFSLAFCSAYAYAYADDAVVGNGSGASCSEAALNAAIAQLYPGANFPGGTLSFNCGEFHVDIPITSAKGLGFGYGTVIEGGGVTLDAQDASQHFVITGDQSRVEIRNILLTHGNAGAGNGGSIYAGPGVNLLLEGVYFGANRAGFAGGAILTDTGSSLVATNTTFLGNGAVHGGAIAANGELTLTDVIIKNNTASSEGGGIQAYFNRTTLLRTEIEANTARFGGGLLQRGGTLDVTESAVVANLATQAVDADGGGLYLYDQAAATGSNVRIAQNRATDLGGGVYLGGENTGNLTPRQSGTSLSLASSRFEGNTARNCGGAYVYGLPANDGGQFAWLDLEDSQLLNNAASAGGGAYSRGRLSANRVLMRDNAATDPIAGFGPGGGLFLASNYDPASGYTPPDQYTFLDQTVVRGNQAIQGGGLYGEDHALLLRGASFVENVASAGGGAWLQGLKALLPISQASFVRNRGSRGAGLGLSLYEPLLLSSLTFADNRLESTSAVQGRDIWLQANSVTPFDVTLRHVTALNPALRPGATLHAEAGATFVYGNSVLYGGSPFNGVESCAGAGTFRTEGGNVVGIGCPFSPPDDIVPDSVAALRLGTLIEDGKDSYYLPATNSPLVDFAPCAPSASVDQRGKPQNQDGNGDGLARCDAGAIERQSTELPPGQLFRDGFES